MHAYTHVFVIPFPCGRSSLWALGTNSVLYLQGENWELKLNQVSLKLCEANRSRFCLVTSVSKSQPRETEGCSLAFAQWGWFVRASQCFYKFQLYKPGKKSLPCSKQSAWVTALWAASSPLPFPAHLPFPLVAFGLGNQRIDPGDGSSKAWVRGLSTVQRKTCFSSTYCDPTTLEGHTSDSGSQWTASLSYLAESQASKRSFLKKAKMNSSRGRHHKQSSDLYTHACLQRLTPSHRFPEITVKLHHP